MSLIQRLVIGRHHFAAPNVTPAFISNPDD